MKKPFNVFVKEFIEKHNLTYKEIASMVGKTEDEVKSIVNGSLTISNHEKSEIRKLLEEFIPYVLPPQIECEVTTKGVTKEQIMYEYIKAYANNSVIFGSKNYENFRKQFQDAVKKLKPSPSKSKKLAFEKAAEEATENSADVITKLFNQFTDRGFEGSDLYFAVELALKYLI